MEKGAYEYRNYLKSLEGATIEEVPFAHYIKPYEPPSKLHQFLYRQDEKGPATDNFFAMKTESLRDRIDLILDGLSGRELINYKNLTDLYRDLMDIYQAKVQLDDTHFHTQSQNWRDVFKQELGLKQQIRSEQKEMWNDTARSASELRDAVLEYKINSQKYRLFSIEDALD